MTDKILLFPYYLALKVRHSLYNKGIKKVVPSPIPTICVGNIAVGGTGKTPHTEMILRTLLQDEQWKDKNIAVLSRGYKRRSKGFQQVLTNDGASFSGDEPAQIKKNFPGVTVAVCKNRNEGLRFLADPDKFRAMKKSRKCVHKDFPAAQVAVLDDSFQYRALKPTVSIVLADYNRPISKDALMPIGRLRDLPERVAAADILIVTKCPSYIETWEKINWLKVSGIKDYNPETCTGSYLGKELKIYFTFINYQPLETVYHYSNEKRYNYSSRAIVFTGIAKAKPMLRYLGDDFKILRHFKFRDHKRFNRFDMKKVAAASIAHPTAVIITTEKDSVRVTDCRYVPKEIKERLFYLPIKVFFTSDKEKTHFESTLLSAIK